MDNQYCHQRYCELPGKADRKNDRLVIAGSYTIFVLLLSVIYWYSVSIGVYIDPVYLP